MEKESLDRIRSWLSGKPAPPFQLEIKPTNLCNLNCLACRARGKSVYSPNEEEGMTLAVYNKLLSDAKKLGVKEVHLSGGGEPLMHKNILEIMQYVKKNELRGSIVTNGSLFTEDEIKKLVKIEWDIMLYSLDGPNAETHDKLREKGVFDKVVKNITLFNHYKEKYNANKPVQDFCLVLSSLNYNKLFDYIKLASKLKIRKLFIQPIRINSLDLGKDLILTSKQKIELKNMIPLLLKLAQDLKIETNLDSLDDSLIEKSCEPKKIVEEYNIPSDKDFLTALPCYSPWFFIGIRSNGDVFPCGVEIGKPLGNICKNTLSEIWYGDDFNSIREILLRKDIPSFCEGCCGMSLMITKDVQEHL